MDVLNEPYDHMNIKSGKSVYLNSNFLSKSQLAAEKISAKETTFTVKSDYTIMQPSGRAGSNHFTRSLLCLLTSFFAFL